MSTVMNAQRDILDESKTERTVEPLQQCLSTLIDLSLQLKQAHWNLVGPGFLSFHVQLDAIIETSRAASDDIAERVAALGVAADGRPAEVAKASALQPFPSGRHSVPNTITYVADRLMTTSECLRASIETLADLDPISEDLLVGQCAQLEKHLWMVQSQEELA